MVLHQLVIFIKIIVIMTLFWSPCATKVTIRSQGVFPLLSELNLTMEQAKKLNELHKNTRARITEILTNEQTHKFFKSLFKPYDFLIVFISMDISKAHRQEIVNIFYSFDQFAQSILTLEQKKVLDHKIYIRVSERIAFLKNLQHSRVKG